MPNVLIEALMVGIPTVSSDCNPGGPRFLTNNGERGLLFEAGNVKSMTDCIIQLIENQQLYNDFEKKKALLSLRY
jgi:glycosyltransferase involved in cell wall biosynthesis